MKRRLYLPLLITALASLVFGVLPLGQPSTVYAAPDEVVLQPSTKDVAFKSNKVEYKGGDTKLELKTKLKTAYEFSRAALEFDTSGIPEDATVTSATLSLYLLESPTMLAGGDSFACYRLTRTDWVELETSWYQYKTGSDWTTVGGDFTTDDAAFQTILTGASGWVDWTVTDQVQYAIDEDINAEFLIKFVLEEYTEGAERKAKFNSNNYTDNLSLRPKLSVTYTTPPSISNSPTSFAFGTVDASSTTSTGLTHFTVTNNSGYPVNITISGTDMTGGVTWTLSDDASIGTNIYGLKAGLEGVDYTIVVKKNGPPYNFLVENLQVSPNNTQSWGLQLLAPDTFTDGGAKSGEVTLTATQA